MIRHLAKVDNRGVILDILWYGAVYVLFPTALGVNPQITILSLATAIARAAAQAG